MKSRSVAIAAAAWIAAASPAAARQGEMTVTGVISDVDPQLRRATITPVGGAPMRVQFVWNAGGVCSICLGGGLKGPTFDQTITPGSTWTLIYTSSYPDSGINTVARVLKPGQADSGARVAADPNGGVRMTDQ